MDNKQIYFIKVKKHDSQAIIKIISKIKKSIINQKYQIIRKDNWIYFPLKNGKESVKEIERFIMNDFKFEIIMKDGIKNPSYKPKTLNDALKNQIKEDYYYLIPKSYDIVGNIALIEINHQILLASISNEELSLFKEKIARAIIEVNKNVISVYEKKSDIKGPHRLREFALIHGKDKSETTHKENNCVFKLDIKRVFFTPRLVYERKRIASSKIKDNELIVDMFAGVGPFSIQIAKKCNVKIHAFDINPHAFNYLKENIHGNKIGAKITPHNLDMKKILESTSLLGKKLKNSADRILMNLPENSLDFIDVACFLMKKTGGILHNYQFCIKPNSVEKGIENLKEQLNKFNWAVEKVLEARMVKAFSPKADLIVVDVEIKKRS